MNRILSPLLVCMVLSSGLLSQDEGVMTELDSIGLDGFEQESRYVYQLFFNSILNLIDDSLPLEDRYRSRLLILDLFENSGAQIRDMIDTPIPKNYNPSSYSLALLKAEKLLPVFYKRFKYSDDFQFNEISGKGMNEGSDILYSRYRGNLFVKEELLNSHHVNETILNSPSFNANENGFIKRIEFNVRQDFENEYFLSISKVVILDRINNSYNYKEISDSIEDSKYPWSDVAQEDYINSIIKEAEANGDELFIPELQASDLDTLLMTSLEGRDTTSYIEPKLVDYVIPGPGHMKYGKSKAFRATKTVLYSAVFVGATGYALYNKIKANEFQHNHISSETFRDASLNLEQARKFNHRYLIGGGVAVSSIAFNALHLKLKHTFQLRKLEKAGYKDGGPNIKSDGTGKSTSNLDSQSTLDFDVFQSGNSLVSLTLNF